MVRLGYVKTFVAEEVTAEEFVAEEFIAEDIFPDIFSHINLNIK